MGFSEIASFIWSLADLLRGDYKPPDYGKVILPFTVLRRLDSIDFGRLLDDPEQIADNLTAAIDGLPTSVRELLLARFGFQAKIARLDEANLLHRVTEAFARIDLRPEVVSNHEMGLIFEELIRRFSQQQATGEHFTPREIIRLMVDLLFIDDREALAKPGVVPTLYDPACGTGGMLSVAAEDGLELEVFGQELNDETFAICRADMLLKGEDPEHIARGNSLSEDGHAGRTFAYMLSNPPFGVDWKKIEKPIRDEHEQLGFRGRFGPGLPRVSDGSLLFLLHMIAKMNPAPSEGGAGSRIAVVFNGSPLFTGDAGSGESEIRRWIIENDWLEAIVALPDQLFYNTGISTYVWIVSNRKPERRRGKVQLINGVERFHKLRRSLGSKRNELGPEHIAELVRIFDEFSEGEDSRIFDNEGFGYRKIVVERPLRLNFQASPERLARLQIQTKQMVAISTALRALDPERIYRSRDALEQDLEAAMATAKLELTAPLEKAILAALCERDPSAEVCTDKRGKREPDPELRDTENVPLREDVRVYFEREVLPHVPDAWIDEDKTKIGYEIPFARHFHRHQPLRPLAEIEQEIRGLEEEIVAMLREVLE